jgi:hypothetical protein
MALTATQSITLKNAITSDASVTSFIANQDWNSIAANYNTNATTLIWRNDIKTQEIVASIVGSEGVKQSVGQMQLLQVLLIYPQIDATSVTVRGQFGAIFPASSAVSTNANLTSVAQRFATKFESLYVSNQVSSLYGYILQGSDVQGAMNG